MRIKLLIATNDAAYAKHLSSILSAHHSHMLDVSVCTAAGYLPDALPAQRYDAALLDPELAKGADLRSIRLPMLLWSDEESSIGHDTELRKVNKYQRVSSIAAAVLECFSRVSENNRSPVSKRAKITAVWSPAGGVGKTSVALAYAAKRVREGKEALYLNLESFSSAPIYFTEEGKSISSVFEMLETNEGNVKMFIQGVQCRENGVSFFCGPENFDDMNILSAENIAVLIDACSELTDELVIDMSCNCSERERQVFELADKILLVTATSASSQIKLAQFANQHNVFERIRRKSTLVNNMGASATKPHVDSVVFLPLVRSADTSAVCKALSDSNI